MMPPSRRGLPLATGRGRFSAPQTDGQIAEAASTRVDVPVCAALLSSANKPDRISSRIDCS